MGAADILFEALESEATRNAIVNQGIRIFKSTSDQANKNEDGGIIGWVWESGKQLVSIVGEAIKLISFSLSSLWGLITSTIQYIWNFDWNMTDETIDGQIKASFASVAGMLGGTLGNTFGYLACGVLPGAVIFAFNEPLGSHLLKNVSEELAEELIGNLSNLIRYTFTSGVQALLLWSFKNVRKWIKSNQKLVKKIFGDKAALLVRAWGEKGNQPWSFALATETLIESIPNQAVRNFVEEFLEEAWEGCVEAGYVLAHSADTYIAEQKQIKKNALGKEKIVQIKPNRTVDEEVIVLAGSQELLKPAIVQTIANYQLINNRDIGTVYAADEDKIARRRSTHPQVVLHFKQSKKEQTGKNQLKGRISFRIMSKTPEQMTNEYLRQMAQKVKAKFAHPSFQWHKGKILVSYTDWDNGYQLELLVNNQNEGRRIIEQILDIQNHNPDWTLMNISSNAEPEIRYSSKPRKKIILETITTQPALRQPGKVAFTYAEMNIPGYGHPITLVDTTGKRKNPVVSNT
jgi:hypothetical protein